MAKLCFVSSFLFVLPVSELYFIFYHRPFLVSTHLLAFEVEVAVASLYIWNMAESMQYT